MTLEQPSADELTLTDGSMALGSMMALLLAICLGAGVKAGMRGSWTSKQVIGQWLGASMWALGAFCFLRKSTLHMDRRTGLATWTRWSLRGTQRWVLTESYSGQQPAERERARDAIRALLGRTSPAATNTLEERVRELVNAGQLIEAIKLVHLEKNIPLKDAKDFVEGLPRT